MTSKTSTPKEAFVWIWLPKATEPIVAGRIERDGERYLFNYGRSYLSNKDRLPIYLPELPLENRQMEPIAPLEIANALRDGAPDAWGRRVIINRMMGDKVTEANNPELDELTYMLHSGSDRIGALDFQSSATEYVARESANTPLDVLQSSADLVEKGLPLSKELAEVLQHGTAIGGARPKTLIENENKKYVAKFSSSTDAYSVVKAEFIAMRLAERAGLSVAPASLTKALGKDVLLIERFDRERTEKGWLRRSMISALTILELDERLAAHASYQDLAEKIRQRFSNPKQTLKELFARMVFNILVGNTDDHARNHAAFWDGEHLELTPAYDICPQARSGMEASQAMQLYGTERRSQLSLCLASSASFLVNVEEAVSIMENQVSIIARHWNDVCKEAGLSEVDRKLFWRRQFLNQLAFEGLKEHLQTQFEEIANG